MESNKFTLHHFGLKNYPFDIDRITPSTLDQIDLQQEMYFTPEVSDIFKNKEEFQLITGLPGTGKSMTFFALEQYYDVELKEKKILSVYIPNVSNLLVGIDYLDESLHSRDTMKNLINHVWKKFFELTYQKINTDNVFNQILKNIKKYKKRDQFKRWLHGISKIANSILRSFFKNKLDIDFDEIDLAEKIPPLTLKDLLDSINAIAELSENLIKKVFFLIDELGEYTRRFKGELKDKNMNEEVIPYFYKFLDKLRGHKNILVKVAGYPETIDIFLNMGWQEDHLHLISLDPTFSNETQYKNALEDFYTLVMNMFLKRSYRRLIDPNSDWRFIGEKGLTLFRSKSDIERLCAFCNFNPRYALKIANFALQYALDKEKKEFSTNYRKTITLTDPTNELEPVSTPINSYVIKYLNDITNAIMKNANDRNKTGNKIEEKYLIFNDFLETLLINGANHFTFPMMDQNDPKYQSFKSLINDLKKTRLITETQGRVLVGNQYRPLYAINTLYLYSRLNSYTYLKGVNESLSLELSNRNPKFKKIFNTYIIKKSHAEVPYYFQIYDIPKQDILSNFKLEPTEVELKNKINNLRNLLDDEDNEEKIDKLENLIRKHRKELVRLRKLRKEEFKKVQIASEVKEEIEIETNEYGETEIEEELEIETNQFLMEQTQIPIKEKSHAKEIASYFKDSSPNIIEVADNIYKLILSEFSKERDFDKKLLKSYIAFKKKNLNFMRIQKLIYSINVFFWLSFSSNRRLYNIFPELRDEEIFWQWNSAGEFWIKLETPDQIKKYKKSMKKMMRESYNSIRD